MKCKSYRMDLLGLVMHSTLLQRVRQSLVNQAEPDERTPTPDRCFVLQNKIRNICVEFHMDLNICYYS